MRLDFTVDTAATYSLGVWCLSKGRSSYTRLNHALRCLPLELLRHLLRLGLALGAHDSTCSAHRQLVMQACRPNHTDHRSYCTLPTCVNSRQTAASCLLCYPRSARPQQVQQQTGCAGLQHEPIHGERTKCGCKRETNRCNIPPQGMRAASLKEVRADSTILASSRWSSALTAVSASAAAVFMCTTVPSRALPCARVQRVSAHVSEKAV